MKDAHIFDTKAKKNKFIKYQPKKTFWASVQLSVASGAEATTVSV
jgi:hypothetical protein